MGKHTLAHHVGLPVAVLAVLVMFGVPLANALPIAIMSGCVAMVLMMSGGHDHAAHQQDDRATKDTPDDVHVGR